MRVIFDIVVPIYLKKWLLATYKSEQTDSIFVRRNSLVGACVDLGCEVEVPYLHRHKAGELPSGHESLKIEMQADTKGVGLTKAQSARLVVVLNKLMRAECVAYVRGYLTNCDQLPDDWAGIDDPRPQLSKEARYRRPLIAFRDKYGIADEELDYDCLRKWYRDVQSY